MVDMTTMGLPCLAAGFLMGLVAVLFVLSAVALIFIILLQKGRGGGLSAALGGGMASGILGAKTGDVLTWVTISLVGVFLVLAVVMTKYWKPTTQQFGAAPAPTTQTQPVQPSQPAPTGQQAPTGQPATTTQPGAAAQPAETGQPAPAGAQTPGTPTEPNK
jgi:preprotein translocase subunit SecG